MTPYRKQEFSQRFHRLGDQAEEAFETACLAAGLSYEVYGWRRPRVDMSKMSANTRATPDYWLGVGCFVEVMGCGRDGLVKLKVEKARALDVWNDTIDPVRFFAYSSSQNAFAFVDWSTLWSFYMDAPLRSFEVDGKEYKAISWKGLLQESIPLGQPT